MAPSNDLPDVMQADSAIGTAGADDLLAQLAGDEIDRLLTEAEANTAEAPVAEPAVVSEVPSQIEQEVPPVTTAIEETPAAEVPADSQAQAAAAMVEAVASADNAIASQLDALFEELSQENPTPAAAVPAPVAQEAPAAPEASVAAEHAELLAESEEEDEHIPLLVKPLLWINAPFGFLSESAKRSLGWAAIVTLVNAGVLLVATYYFKKH